MSDFFENYGKSNQAKNQGDSDQKKSSDSDFFANYPVLQQGESHQNFKQESQAEQKVSIEPETQQNMDSLFKELNSLIGLQKVKAQVRELTQYVRVQEMRRQEGLGVTNLSLHSVFRGSPGTGKTIVARIYSKMLKAMGLLSKGHFVETDRAGLVGNYIGQTANKTDEKIKEALGGVLFIDEAYSLYKGEHAQWDYGSEAIEVLMKRMEDNRSDFAVIVAGYPTPMEEFLNSNEGFRSRFVNTIDFEDYSPDELMQIFSLLCYQNNYSPKKDAIELVKIIIESAYANRDKRFGNARDVRTTFEKIIKYQALRIGETTIHPTNDQLQVIEPEDVYPLLHS